MHESRVRKQRLTYLSALAMENENANRQNAADDLENLGAWAIDQDDVERDVARKVSSWSGLVSK